MRSSCSTTVLPLSDSGEAPFPPGMCRYCPPLLPPDTETVMTRTDWLYKFRRIHNPDTLEKLYEHLSYTGDPAEEFVMTQAYDHRKAELATGKLFDRVPQHVWHFVK